MDTFQKMRDLWTAYWLIFTEKCKGAPFDLSGFICDKYVGVIFVFSRVISDFWKVYKLFVFNK